MGLRWFNVLGLVMLCPVLFFNDVIYLNVQHECKLVLIPLAIAYISTALWLSSRRD